MGDNTFKTLRPRQNGRHFADDILKCIFLNEKIWISRKIFLMFSKFWINNIPVLVQVIAWRWPSDKPLPEPMVVNLLMHICVTRPQWVNADQLIVCSLFNTLLPKLNGHRFTTGILKCIILTGIRCRGIQIDWNLFPRVQIAYVIIDADNVSSTNRLQADISINNCVVYDANMRHMA